MNEQSQIPDSAESALDIAVREDEIKRFLLQQYGPLLTRDDLVKVLGFPTGAAFDRYWQRGHLNMELVRPPNRRGVFALAQNVARYLVEIPRESVGYKREEETGRKN